MLSILKDLVAHSQPLGVLTMLRLTEENNGITIDSISDDTSLILNAKTINQIPEFTGVFGMPDIAKLSYLVKNSEYQKDAKITVKSDVRNGIKVPTQINFENATGDFNNTYRFMNQAVIDERLKKVEFQGAKWDVEFEPTVQAYDRLKNMAGAHSGEKVFRLQTKDGNLVFNFGDAASYAGEFVFQHNVSGTLNNNFFWPVEHMVSILGLTGNKRVSITNQGAIKISVDSGLIKYDYILPSQQK